MKKGNKRTITQIVAAIATNGHIQGFLQKSIFKGASKKFCVPGMNCYSCPGAFGACPIGSLQAVLGSVKYKASFYVGGIIGLLGAVFGRWICGWLCVFGFIEDLLYKVPLPKINIPKKADRIMRYFKYVLLVLLVILFPIFLTNKFGMAPPYFCEWVCPVGTLEGGIPLVLLQKSLRKTIGFLFYWKFVILVLVIVSSMVIYRPFCKYLCPLGAIYGIFNKISLVRLRLDKDKCVSCNKCTRACHMQVEPCKVPDSAECIRCGACVKECPTEALHIKFMKK